jgi:hypothetical protein
VSEIPNDPIDGLRSYLLGVENFPSLKRYSVANPKSDIAIDLFLNGHILVYAHQTFFKNGVDQFKKIVQTINSIRPDIEWNSLGYISQRLYLEKIRNEGECDILAFCNNIILENKHRRKMTYFVCKEESNFPRIKQVLVDNQPTPHAMKGEYLFFKTTIPPGESRNIFVEYENDLDVASVDPWKTDVYISFLRRASDFRDMVVSRSAVGNRLIILYYSTGDFKVVLMVTIAMVVVLIGVVISYRYKSKRRKNKSVNSSSSEPSI